MQWRNRKNGEGMLLLDMEEAPFSAQSAEDLDLGAVSLVDLAKVRHAQGGGRLETKRGKTAAALNTGLSTDAPGMSRERGHVQSKPDAGTNQRTLPLRTRYLHWSSDCALSLKDIGHVHAHLKILCFCTVQVETLVSTDSVVCSSAVDHPAKSRGFGPPRRSKRCAASRTKHRRQPSFRSLPAFSPPRTVAVTQPFLTPCASAFSRIAHTGQFAGVLQSRSTHKSTLEQNT